MMRRGQVLAWLARTGTALVLAACAWPVLSFVSWRGGTTARVRFAPEDQADHAYRDGVYLIRSDTGWEALSARCTHLCCIVAWDGTGNRFVCPCHRSQYDAQGRRLSGRAARDLDRLPLRRLSDGSLEVEVHI